MEINMIDNSIFDEIYAVMLQNADKILSALAFIGTIIVGFAYKKGLLPLLGKAMTAINRSVDGIKEDGVKSAKETEKKLTDIDSSLKEIEAAAKSVHNIEELLVRYERVMSQYDAMKTVMSAQTDMLYAVFMASAVRAIWTAQRRRSCGEARRRAFPGSSFCRWPSVPIEPRVLTIILPVSLAAEAFISSTRRHLSSISIPLIWTWLTSHRVTERAIPTI